MRYFILFLGIAFSFGGAVWSFRSFRIIQSAKRSIGWPVVPGVITYSKVLLVEKSYLPTIEYKYEFDGRSHTGDSLNIGLPYSASKSRADFFVGRYPVGSAAQVAVDPARPSISVLEPGIRWHMYLVVFASILMAMLGCALLYLASKYLHEFRAQQTASCDRSKTRSS